MYINCIYFLTNIHWNDKIAFLVSKKKHEPSSRQQPEVNRGPWEPGRGGGLLFTLLGTIKATWEDELSFASKMVGDVSSVLQGRRCWWWFLVRLLVLKRCLRWRGKKHQAFGMTNVFFSMPKQAANKMHPKGDDFWESFVSPPTQGRIVVLILSGTGTRYILSYLVYYEWQCLILYTQYIIIYIYKYHRPSAI